VARKKRGGGGGGRGGRGGGGGAGGAGEAGGGGEERLRAMVADMGAWLDAGALKLRDTSAVWGL